eukprot:2919152-Pyramimonas_sp.AAC.1
MLARARQRGLEQGRSREESLRTASHALETNTRGLKYLVILRTCSKAGFLALWSTECQRQPFQIHFSHALE